jgi:hypothetical protein
MSNIETATARLAFDDILEAVQESRRGRWFLQEYEARLQKRDSKNILDAINRLEARMDGLGAAAPGELGRVRSAISNARNDLLKLGMGKQAMSEEGRLFAELADMARKAIPESEQSAGIVRSLQLVEEIERTVSAERGGNFFAADSQIFEKPPVAAKPVLVEKPEPMVVVPAAQPKKTEATPSTGAKLVIRKATQDADPAPVAEQPAVQPPAEVAAPLPMATPDEPMIADHPRIVLVRRKPEDMPDISVSEAVESSASAA